MLMVMIRLGDRRFGGVVLLERGAGGVAARVGVECVLSGWRFGICISGDRGRGIGCLGG